MKPKNTENVKKYKSPLSAGNVLLGILLFQLLTFIELNEAAFIITRSYDFFGVSVYMA